MSSLISRHLPRTTLRLARTKHSRASSISNHQHLDLRSPRYRTFTTTPAKMSAPGKYEYLVQVPDHANAVEKRIAIRPQHLKNLTPRVQSGQVVFGGATLSSQPKEGETPGFTGSVMLIRADSEEEVRAIVEQDVYVEGGAWDLSGMTITAFKCAVRTAM